ncbi:TPA: formylmethionine deformylase [Candidatus Latescibacteria bacterium]|nr:formylmethionine deformylase [Candidatus Latescibacterota bacterium]
MKRQILLLGDPRLYESCDRVDNHASVAGVAEDMFDTIRAFRRQHGWGRAIAAPQVGARVRLVCMDIGERIALLNPEIEFPDGKRVLVWDNCMSFPELLVKVERFRRCHVRYRDLDWQPQEMAFEGDLSELIQHEVDHLDGILTIQRAVDDRSIILRSQRDYV